ncbi:MAG: NAD(P)H-binding protein [Phycisphaerales bacterium]|nr:NAD(P)H-binding protein [Phycisphaerales bacterium]
MSQQTVALAGATGFVGRHIARELVSRGYGVRALARDRDKAAGTLPRQGVTVVLGDALDPEAASELCAGCKTVINAIGIRRELPSKGVTFVKAHVRSTRTLLDAAGGAGASHFILVSALGVRADAPTAYYRSKYEGESLVRSSGIDWTIFRPSLIHGADGEFIGMVRDWTLGRAAPRFFIPYFAKIELKQRPVPHPAMVSAKVAPVGVDDVARAIVNAMERPEARGEVYPLCGPETLDWPELLAAVRDAVPLNDSKKRILPIPAIKGVMAARAAEAVGMGEMLPFGPSEPVMAAEDSVCSVAKAEAHLDFSGVGFREALASYRDQI